MADKWIKRGGQEPPPEAEDQPEQNEAYDEVAHGGPPLPNDLVEPDEVVPAPPEDQGALDRKQIDERAAARAAADVRRRERSAE